MDIIEDLVIPDVHEKCMHASGNQMKCMIDWNFIFIQETSSSGLELLMNLKKEFGLIPVLHILIYHLMASGQLASRMEEPVRTVYDPTLIEDGMTKTVKKGTQSNIIIS